MISVVVDDGGDDDSDDVAGGDDDDVADDDDDDSDDGDDGKEEGEGRVEALMENENCLLLCGSGSISTVLRSMVRKGKDFYY